MQFIDDRLQRIVNVRVTFSNHDMTTSGNQSEFFLLM